VDRRRSGEAPPDERRQYQIQPQRRRSEQNALVSIPR
jgi:hypothetical protein